jgi:hypothetical protein
MQALFLYFLKSHTKLKHLFALAPAGQLQRIAAPAGRRLTCAEYCCFIIIFLLNHFHPGLKAFCPLPQSRRIFCSASHFWLYFC